jgi:hypothetical protein
MARLKSARLPRKDSHIHPKKEYERTKNTAQTTD